MMLGTENSDLVHAGWGSSVRDSYTTMWSSPSAELDAYSPYPQEMIPDDLPTPSTSQLDASFEPAAIDIDFDYSCLDGLDEKLLHYPFEAFAELCWTDAVEGYELSKDDRSATPTPSSHPTIQQSPRYSDLSVGSTAYYDSDEEDDFQWRRKRLTSGTITPRAVKTQCPVIPPFEFNGDRTSFILFEPYFATAEIDVPVGPPPSYPGAKLSKHSLPSRIVSICSTFPGRLIKA
ncbi:hypothetical protein VKT23_000491 [Stygiomarasmius scandens]